MRKAYLIGNASYNNKHWKALNYSINDIHILKSSLEKCDFNVELYEDATRYDLGCFMQIGQEVEKFDTVLVYYSGHGFEEAGEAYLVPVDADDKTQNCMNITDVLEFICSKEGVKCIFILDCCRNIFSAEEDTSSGKKRNIQKIKSRHSTFVCFSTTLGNSALDEGSIFAKALSEIILEDKICIEKVFKKIRTYVIRESEPIKQFFSPGEIQVTCDYSTLIDEFYFTNTDIDKQIEICAGKIDETDTLGESKEKIRFFYDNEMDELKGSIDFNSFKDRAWKLLAL